MKNNILILLLDGNRGIYIPQIFADDFADQLTDEDKKDLSNPDNENYWEAWEDVIERSYTIDGVKYFLEQRDGDLWAIKDGYSMNEDGDIVNDETSQTVEI